MAFLIYTNNPRKKKILELIKKIFSNKGLLLKEYNIQGQVYLASYLDPTEVLPTNILYDIKINRISGNDLKKLETMNIKSAIDETKPKEGKKVKIINGPYKDYKGLVVKELKNDKYLIVISIFGMDIPVEIKKDEIVTI